VGSGLRLFLRDDVIEFKRQRDAPRADRRMKSSARSTEERPTPTVPPDVRERIVDILALMLIGDLELDVKHGSPAPGDRKPAA
jgi:hypothetical protein